MDKLIRDLMPALDLMNKLQKTQRAHLIHRGALNGTTALLKKNAYKGFNFEISNLATTKIDVGDKIRFKARIATQEIKITSAYCKSIKVENKNSYSQLHIIDVQSFEKNIDCQRKYYGRNIISIKDSLPFNYVVEAKSYSHVRGSQRGLIQVSLLHPNDYTVYCYSQEDKHYLVIDGELKKCPKEFREDCWSILVSLGYLQGYLPQDEEYTFFYSSRIHSAFTGFAYHTLRNTLSSLYMPVYSNPYAWKAITRKQADKYYKQLRNISQPEFSNLCRWVHSEIDIKAILLLILEATKTSLLTMPAGLSVALEGLTEYFYDKNKQAFQPVVNKKTCQEIVKKLKEVIAEYQFHPDVQNFSTLQVKIDSLNAPTNAEKLKAPFRLLEISLSKIDEETIDYRNDFLHGNINLKPRKGKKSYNLSSFEIGLRLLTLLNAVILKKIGYNGFILNHVKLQEGTITNDVTEQFYRSLGAKD
ncbi:MAG TPA: hypothetical protein VGN63_16855 [Flavisolibacter sp.]|jgi:hypothetical protein|nr:hypothetical protein [Flavisolibacter sp.]